jgi:hypothetical protein
VGALVEVDLPAGAELDEDSRVALRRRLANSPSVAGRTLALRLRALAPGGTVRIPMPLRWSLGGTLHGLGAAAYTSADPGAAATLLAPRTVTIPEAGEEPRAPSGTPTEGTP